jgi:SPP1 gp7 family putative phage head morphogenesis protein
MTKRLILTYENILGKLVMGLANRFIEKTREKVFWYKSLLEKQSCAPGAHDVVDKSKISLGLIEDLDQLYDLYELEEVRHRAKNIIRRYMNLSYRKGVEKGVSDLARVNITTSFMMTKTDLQAVDIFVGKGVSLVKGATDDMKKEMLRVISEGIVKGDSMDTMARGMLEKAGITRGRAKMIARTETIIAYNQASINQYKKVGITQWRWIAAYDERTCPVCSAKDGKIFDIGDIQPGEIHPNCRCGQQPYIDEETTPG